MRIIMDDIHRLCDETNMEYDEAVALLRRFEGDYRKALRTWQDERSVFIEPVCIKDGVRPVSDRIRQAWRNSLALIRRVQPLRLISLIALIAAFVCSKPVGGWMMFIMMLLRCMPLICQLLSCRLSRAKRPDAHIVL